MAHISATLLATKLYLPPLRPNFVPRPRLTRRLAEGLARPLTLISAPAGFGKTTLLTEWRATPAGAATPLAWLSLDRHDNEPSRFWAYVAGAIQGLPGLGQVTCAPGAGGPADLLTPLINQLAALNQATPAVLVLDDYHAIETPAIHEAVAYLVEHLPPRLRLVVLTRSDPPWPLARLRAHGLMAELRSADLRFTAGEAAAFLGRTDLGAAEIAALERRTEGWIAALQMVALSLEGHADPRAFVAAFSGDNRYIADYLAEEVIARQPPPVQEFLLATAILSRLSAPLCEAVTGQAGGQALLEQVERANLFLVPLDAERRWYRYHHLFADLLRARLMQSRPELVPELHSRASRWFEASGASLEAVEHALAAGEHDRAARLIERYANDWWALASSQFLALMMKLPPQVIRSRPVFAIYSAWVNIVAGDLATAAEFLQAAGQAEATPAVSSFSALMGAYIAAMTGQPYALTEMIRRAPGQIPEAQVAMRNSADVVLAFLVEMSGDLEQAAALLEGVARRDLAYGTTNGLPIAIARVAKIRHVQGRTAEAEALLRRYLALTGERGAWRFFLNGNLHAARSSMLLAQGLLEEAAAEAAEGLRQNERWGTPAALAVPLLALARVNIARGELDKAAGMLERIAVASRDRTLQMDTAAELSAVRINLLVARGDLPAAQLHAAERGLSPQMEAAYRIEAEQIAYARLLAAQGRRTEADGLLRRLAAAAEAGGRPGRLAEIRRVLAPAPAAPGPALPERLSERELEILRLMAEGQTNQQIADRLYLSVGTVKTHIHNLSGKLEAQSRTHAVARARALRLL